MNPIYWMVRISLKFLFFLFYRHRIYGLNHICKGRAIISPTHDSFLDPPLIAASWPKEVAFLARKSLFTYPIFSALIKKLNAYPVSGTAQDLQSIKTVCQLLKKNQQVVIFPSGSRSHDNSIGDVKNGIGMIALRSHAPIIPVYIHGCFEIWDRSHRFPKLKGRTACVIGSPIYWQSFDHQDKKSGQVEMTQQVKVSWEALKAWYENGAVGSPP